MLEIRAKVPLAPLTTFGIGGPARYFVDVKTEDEIREAIYWARERKMHIAVWGGGSNMLVPDKGLDAVVVHIAASAHSFSGEFLHAEAGCNLLSLIRDAAKFGLGGWEKLAGIPGTIGGAVRGNAGAFGPEIKDFAIKVRALNSNSLQVREFDNDACNFSYRHSFFKDNPEWIILLLQLKLAQADSTKSLQLIAETIQEREKRHIQNVRAAGSFFVNPVAPTEIQEMFEKERGAQSREGRVPAGWLIEKVGLKGAHVGDAIASEQHPNYIKNNGRAKAKDVLALAEKIKAAVKKDFGIELQEEAVVL